MFTTSVPYFSAKSSGNFSPGIVFYVRNLAKMTQLDAIREMKEGTEFVHIVNQGSD